MRLPRAQPNTPHRNATSITISESGYYWIVATLFLCLGCSMFVCCACCFCMALFLFTYSYVLYGFYVVMFCFTCFYVLCVKVSGCSMCVLLCVCLFSMCVLWCSIILNVFMCVWLWGVYGVLCFYVSIVLYMLFNVVLCCSMFACSINKCMSLLNNIEQIGNSFSMCFYVCLCVCCCLCFVTASYVFCISRAQT
jgi:hypothetical protein